MKASFTVALAGNPNCGKTTIFNQLTGLRHKVANYPGVTVEKKTGKAEVPTIGTITVVDLPGTYALSSLSPDENIATAALLGLLSDEPLPDLIISVIDASNLERNLYLATQLIDVGIPIILALNMQDIAERRGISIKKERLSHFLDVPVIGLSASKGTGIDQLLLTIASALKNLTRSRTAFAWQKDTSPFLEHAKQIGTLAASKNTLPGASVILGAALLSEAIQAEKKEVKVILEEHRTALIAEKIDPFSFEATKRYEYIHSIVRNSTSVQNPEYKSRSDRLDAFLTHKVYGSLCFLLIMGFIFQAIFTWASVPMDLIDTFFGSLRNYISPHIPEGTLRSLITDGIIPGVGSVVIFVPQIALLFLFLGILEDSGYLSRAAFLMDNLMRRVGLQGRSFIPLLSSFACAIPGIMATRSIPSFADRMVTILVAPLMSCSARLPVYTLLIAAFIPHKTIFGFFSLQGLVLLSMYLLGIFSAAIVSFLLKKLLLRGEPALFVMEMPPYRVPAFASIGREILDRVVIFLKSAGTIILACSILLWFLASYPSGEIKESFAGKIGAFIEPAIKPLGFNWEIGVGLLASFAAREVFVSSLATVYSIAGEGDSASGSLITLLQQKESAGTFTLPMALSLMVFYVYACQCMSTLAVCKRETNSWRWPLFMFSYMTVLAYIASFITYRISVWLL